MTGIHIPVTWYVPFQKDGWGNHAHNAFLAKSQCKTIPGLKELGSLVLACINWLKWSLWSKINLRYLKKQKQTDISMSMESVPLTTIEHTMQMV